MAILQFMASGLDRTAVPTSIHCDHLIVGNKGAKTDLEVLCAWLCADRRRQLIKIERFSIFSAQQHGNTEFNSGDLGIALTTTANEIWYHPSDCP